MKKTGKRLSALLLALVMVLSLLPMTALAARVEDDAVAIAAPDTTDNVALSATMPDAPAELAEAEELPETPAGNLCRPSDGAQVTAEASSCEVSNGQLAPKFAIDGDTTTSSSRWASTTDYRNSEVPQWIQIDLGKERAVSFVKIVWERRNIIEYNVQVSRDGTENSWKTVYNHQESEEVQHIPSKICSISFEPTQARYIKVEVTKWDNNEYASSYNVSIYEIEVYRDANLSLLPGVTATASSYEADSTMPGNAIDGKTTGSDSRWSSRTAAGDDWIQIDLHHLATVSGINIYWELLNISAYRLEVSADQTNWTAVHDHSGGYITQKNETFTFEDLYSNVRYIRLSCSHDAGSVGYANASLYEIEVFGAALSTELTRLDGVTATASTVELGTDFTPDKAIDGDISEGSRWNTKNERDNQWIQIDLHRLATVDGICLYWHRANITSYRLEVSADQTNWTTVYSTSERITQLEELFTFEHSYPNVRYIRLYCDGHDTGETQAYYNVGLREIEIYGTAGELLEMSDTVTVKVQTSNGDPVTDAAITLTDSLYNVVQDVTGTAKPGEDGSYTIDVSSLADGVYYARASKDESGTMIGTNPAIVVENGKAPTNFEYTVILDPIESEGNKANYKFTMEEGSRPMLGISTVNNHPVEDYDTTENALTLHFSNIYRMDNIVKLLGTNMKDGVIEFDAARQSENPDTQGRFGLAFRLVDEDDWIYVGQFGDNDKWANEFWYKKNGYNVDDYSRAAVSGPSFGNGDSRHFKVTIATTSDTTTNITLEIDGIQVYSQDLNGSATTVVPSTAADVGFVCGNGGVGVPADITIDNLYVFRNDLSFTVTKTGSVDLTAKIISSAGDQNLYDGGTKSPAGERIKITAEDVPEGYMLDKVTVTETSPANGSEAQTIQADYVEDGGYFVFVMPAYDVTIQGTILPKLTGVTLNEGTDKANLRVGKQLSSTVTAGGNDNVTTGVTYQWYHENNGGTSDASWELCTDSTARTSTKTVHTNDEGKRVKLEVRGDGITYALHSVVEKISSGTMDTAFVNATGVALARDQIEMWTNLDNDPNPDNKIEGNTTTLTATIETVSGDPTGITVKWLSSNTAVATVTPGTVSGKTATATVNALTNGEATITVAVLNNGDTDVPADQATHKDAVKIKSQTQVTSVAMRDGYNTTTKPLVIYANTGKNTASVVADVQPDGNNGSNAASNRVLSWRIAYSNVDGVSSPTLSVSNNIEIEGNEGIHSSGNGVTITAEVDPERVGEATVTVRSDSDPTKYDTFTVQVWRELVNDISISSTNSTPRIGDVLEVSTPFTMTDAGWNGLSYQWKRGTTKDVESAEDITENGDGSTYTLVEADRDKYIFVVVTPAPSTFYTGTKTAVTQNPVSRQAAPAAPKLAATHITELDGKGSITIQDYDDGVSKGYTYEYASNVESGQENWTNVLANPIQDLAAGTYWVRVKETTIREPGAQANVTIKGYDEQSHDIAIDPDMTGGTVQSSVTSALAGTQVTLTVQPDADHGYEYVADSLTVTKESGGAVEGGLTPVDGQANKFTFTMPAENVTVSAQFKLRTVRIYHDLSAGLTCNQKVTEEDDENESYHPVTYSEQEFKIVLTVEEGFDPPEGIKVTLHGSEGSELGSDSVKFSTSADGRQVTITFPKGVTQDIVITATATKKTYRVQLKNTNSRLTLTGNTSVLHDEDFTGKLTVNDNAYRLPKTITVTMGGSSNVLSSDKYTYDNTNGNLTIPNVTGAVEIDATAELITYEMKSVTITGTAQVGGTLRISAIDPDTATVDYQWFQGDTKESVTTPIDGATNANLPQIAETLKDKYITLHVTGTGSYTGTVISNVLGPVAAEVIPATGITLNKTSLTLVFGASETLEATVKPDNATDTNVTWSSSNTEVATVDGGVVTAKKVGSATITATDSAGHDTTCRVTVTAVTLTGVTLTGTTQEGETLTANITPTAAVSASTIRWYRVDADSNGADIPLNNNNNTTYTLTTDDVDHQIKVSVTGAGNYTGTVTATSDTVIAAETDTTELAQAIKDAEALNSTDYTEDSWADLQAALSAAKETLADETATQDDVDAAAKALTDAIAALEEKGEEPGPGEDEVTKDALDAAIKDAEALNSTDYTEDSWAELQEALSAAKETLADEDATQDDVDDALDALTAAVNALVKKGTDEPEPDQPTRKPIRPATPSPSSSENPDGSKETAETKPDGTVTETVENPDGSKEIVETKPDGTVIDTVVAADGATTEKVTDPEGDVTIIVTDADGEELAKVELPAATPDPEEVFIDLDPTPWAEDAINHMAGLGLVKGVGGHKYDPIDSMTRGALATVLYRLSQGKADYNVTFQDVAQGKYYTEGVAWAARVNVVTGYSEDIFAPDDTITREQLAVMLARYAKLIGMDTTADTAALDQFVDGDNTGDWAVNGMAWCVEQGILQGKGADNLDPTAKITRAEVAVMLDRFIALIK